MSAEIVLTAPVYIGATTLFVADASGFPTIGTYSLKIDNETVTVSAVSRNTLTVGAIQTYHSQGAIVNVVSNVGSGSGSSVASLRELGSFTKLTALNRNTVRKVMTSPPTVLWTTVNSITGRQWFANNGNYTGANGGGGADFSFTRAGSLKAGVSAPNYDAVLGTSVNYGSGGKGQNVLAASFIHTGIAFSVKILGYSTSVLVKVDDEYVTMTPQSYPNDGSVNYGIFTFAASARRRIEILMTCNNFNGSVFGGVFTAATDTVEPAQIRGCRSIFVGDSFVEGSLATATGASAYPVVFSEIMGWDDVWSSGVGATGFVAAPGGKLKYFDRLSTDVIPYSPDIVVFQPSVNDAGSTASAVNTEALACFNYIRNNLPDCLIVCTSPMLSKAASYSPLNLLTQRALLKTTIQSVGGIFIDLQQLPLPSHITPQSTTLTASRASGAGGTVSTAVALSSGNTYQFSDGTTFRVLSTAGLNATVDNIGTSQSNGATVTQVGSCLWSGTGYVGATTGVGNCDILVGSDGVHPTQAGHEAIAEAVAFGFLNQLYIPT